MNETNQNDTYTPGETQHRVLPAYEHVKLNIIFYWFKMQTEFQNYIFVKSLNKETRIEKITSMILALYLTMLKSSLHKRKKEELIKKLDKYIAEDYKIPEDELVTTLGELESFLYEIGYLNTLYEQKPWEDQFRNEYPV